MGLLKGSQIQFSASETLIGQEVVVVPLGGPAASAPPAAPALTGTVPADEGAAPLDDALLGVAAPWELTAQVPETAAPGAPAPLAEYDGIKAHLHDGAVEAAERDYESLEGAYEEAREHHAATALQDAEARLDAIGEEAPRAEVLPRFGRAAELEAELTRIGTLNELKWSHLQRIETKIAQDVGLVAEDLEARFAPETFAQLLADREGILAAARLEAERLVLEAETRAASKLAEAERDAAERRLDFEAERERLVADLRAEARQEGFDEGKAEGEAQAARYVEEALVKLNEIAIAFPAAVKRNEEKLVSLALEIAKKIIQDEIALQPEIVQRTVETALRRVSDLDQVLVKVNPLDLDLILPKADRFRAIVPDVQNFAIEGSHTIERGGCMIETASGSINATLHAQIGIIEELFKNVRAEYEDDGLGGG